MSTIENLPLWAAILISALLVIGSSLARLDWLAALQDLL